MSMHCSDPRFSELTHTYVLMLHSCPVHTCDLLGYTRVPTAMHFQTKIEEETLTMSAANAVNSAVRQRPVYVVE